MKSILTAAILSATASLCGAEGFRTGLRDLAIADDGRPLEGFVWYPTEETEGAERLLGNPVWEGIEAIPGAAPAGGRYPLVVLSHGMYGNAMNQAWLAAELSSRGYVVAAVHHPGTSTWLRDPEDARQMWERPRDVSRVIDALEADPMVDADRVFVAGHSLGGFTVALLAGARFAPDQLDALCAEDAEALICGVFTGWNVAQTPEDRAAMSVDLSDGRIDAVAVFDLGGTQLLSRESLGGVDVPMIVYGAPIAELGGLDLDAESRALVAALPGDVVTYHEPDTLAHFDFLGVCTEAGRAILAEEEPEDEFVCIDGHDIRRAEQAVIADQVDAFFRAAR